MKMELWITRLTLALALGACYSYHVSQERDKALLHQAASTLREATSTLLDDSDKMDNMAEVVYYAYSVACYAGHKGDFVNISSAKNHVICSSGVIDTSSIPEPLDSKARDAALGHPEHNLTL